ncbi:hypothetical protein TPA0909_55050 [Streptomyces albus]|nr:hypothetical protein TPA0909_55050 [Streptomyces albus]
MGAVGAAAQHQPYGPPREAFPAGAGPPVGMPVLRSAAAPAVGEFAGDEVVVDAPAAAHQPCVQPGPGVQQARLGDADHGVLDGAQETGDLGDGLGRAGVADAALVGGDADDGEGGLGGGCPGDGECLRGRAAARTAARVPDLHEDRQRRPAGVEGCAQQTDAFEGVHVRGESELRIGGEFPLGPAGEARVHQWIGVVDAPGAPGPEDAGLMGRGHGDGPRAEGLLTRVQGGESVVLPCGARRAPRSAQKAASAVRLASSARCLSTMTGHSKPSSKSR